MGNSYFFILTFYLFLFSFHSNESQDYFQTEQVPQDNIIQEDNNKSYWENNYGTGDILEIADIEWAEKNAPYFEVSNKEELAGVVYYVNSNSDPYAYYTLILKNDIDLKGIDWVPMGYLGSSSNQFCGEIDGRGYSIKNMHITEAYENHSAFVAYSTDLQVHDITFDNAHICSANYCGIIGGEIYTTNDWYNIKVKGFFDSYSESAEMGTIIGREAYIAFKNCKGMVIAKNKNEENKHIRIDWLSKRQQIIEETTVNEDFTLVRNADGSITRDDLDLSNYVNLCWHVERDGSLVLQRLAENELTLPVEYLGEKVWLEAYINGTYIRVSNIIE